MKDQYANGIVAFVTLFALGGCAASTGDPSESTATGNQAITASEIGGIPAWRNRLPAGGDNLAAVRSIEFVLSGGIPPSFEAIVHPCAPAAVCPDYEVSGMVAIDGTPSNPGSVQLTQFECFDPVTRELLNPCPGRVNLTGRYSALYSPGSGSKPSTLELWSRPPQQPSVAVSFYR